MLIDLKTNYTFLHGTWLQSRVISSLKSRKITIQKFRFHYARWSFLLSWLRTQKKIRFHLMTFDQNKFSIICRKWSWCLRIAKNRHWDRVSRFPFSSTSSILFLVRSQLLMYHFLFWMRIDEASSASICMVISFSYIGLIKYSNWQLFPDSYQIA